jgi:hypothetical protein
VLGLVGTDDPHSLDAVHDSIHVRCVSGERVGPTGTADSDERERLPGSRGLAEAGDSLLAVNGNLVRAPAPTAVEAQDVEIRFLRGVSARDKRPALAATRRTLSSTLGMRSTLRSRGARFAGAGVDTGSVRGGRRKRKSGRCRQLVTSAPKRKCTPLAHQTTPKLHASIKKRSIRARTSSDSIGQGQIRRSASDRPDSAGRGFDWASLLAKNAELTQKMGD